MDVERVSINWIGQGAQPTKGRVAVCLKLPA